MAGIYTTPVIQGNTAENTTKDSRAKISYRDAGLFSRTFVTWLAPLLYLGYRCPLEAGDIPPLDEEFTSGSLESKLCKAWEARKTSMSPASSLLLCSYSDVFGVPFYFSGIIKLVGDACILSCPLVLMLIIKDLQSVHSDSGTVISWFGIALCFSIFLLRMGNTIAVNSYFAITMQTGLKVRTASSALIYAKSLRLSGVARQKFSTGYIVNLANTDGTRIEMATLYLHYLWSGPLQVTFIIAFMFSIVGWATLAGFTFFLMLIPIQSRVATVLSRYRKETSKATDSRVRLMHEILQGIRAIKFYAWETKFLEKLFDLRSKELYRIRTSQNIRAIANAMTAVTAIFSCILTFLVYYWTGNRLTAEVVFPTLALFNLMRNPLLFLPMTFSMSIDANVAVKRIQQFLLAEELDFSVDTEKSSEFSVTVEQGHFVWESLPAPADTSSVAGANPTSKTDLLKSPKGGDSVQAMALKDINFKIRKGALVAIVGPVGSGKSSLLGALVGELKSLSGRILYGGSVAYCPQQAWIQNVTVRDNILFGSAYVEERYEAVLTACALRPDLEVLIDGDMTEIGEKGVNLSGGQKQRISLARAAYSNVDVVLLDDPLSAVDAHVGKHLMDECINGIMAGRTRLLVTHQLYLVPNFDHVIFMEAGQILEQGTFEELVAQGLDFAKLISTHGDVKNQSSEGLSNIDSQTLANQKADLHCVKRPSKQNKTTEPVDLPNTRTQKPLQAIKPEERIAGAASVAIYRNYLVAAGGLFAVLATLISVILWNLARISTDYWVSIWASGNPLFKLEGSGYMTIYISLGILQGMFALTTCLAFAWGGLRAARVLHNKAASRIILAPISFFDTNPVGRIISRFGKDQDVLDNLVSESLRTFVYIFALTISTFTMMIVVNVFFAAPLFFLLAIYHLVQSFYRRSSREIKRLESQSRLPLYGHFSETLTGLPTIRAFGQQDRFISCNQTLININNSSSFVQLASQRWLGLRLESIGNLIILSAALCSYIFKIPAGLAGLTIGYSLSVTAIMNSYFRQAVDLESQVMSSERLGHYANKLPQEAPHAIPGASGNEKWLERGTIEINGLSMRYRADLPLVLDDITVSIRAGERVGIVGRTGAGKSSIMLALFRIIEPSAGSVTIDGVDISELGLTRLRSQISIIPQDPVVFAGTVRWNLDPHSKYSDQTLWDALEQAHLKPAIMAMDHGLESPIQEGGENLSVGQRQLLCLARVILQKNVLLILDEATANIDLATDALIQHSIRRDFSGCTILTIAHRINTVIDYDRIMVLEMGRVVEFDTPANLLSQEDSLLASLVRETGEQNEALLRSMVNTPYKA